MALTLAAGASAGIPASAEIASPDFSSDESIHEYLVSLGIDPATAVIQRGINNYAGPNCPGIGWTCASGDVPTVQVAQSGANVFEPPASAEAQECTVIQANTTGPNVAACPQDTTANGSTQYSRIEQTNQSGANTATVTQRAAVAEAVALGVEADFDQHIAQEAAIYQRSLSGANAATLDQLIDLSAEARSLTDARSRQDGSSVGVVRQQSDTGDQTATVKQVENMRSSFFRITNDTRQEQQTRATEENIVGVVDQHSGAGRNYTSFTQDQNLTMEAEEILGIVTEIQSNEQAAMRGQIDQDTTNNTSSYDANITKNLVMDQDAHVAIQFEDPTCCDIIGLSPSTPTTCSIVQKVTLTGPAVADQNAFAHGRSFAEVNCIADLTVTLNRGDVQTVAHERREGTLVDVMIRCDSGVCTTADGQPEQPETGGNLHLALRNSTIGQAFSPTDAQRPNSTSAKRGDVLEFKIEFHNHTSVPISEITLYSKVPAGTRFLDCKACVNGTPDANGVITFNRGTGEANGKRGGTFRVVVEARPTASPFSTHQATATTKTSAPVSNEVHYYIVR